MFALHAGFLSRRLIVWCEASREQAHRDWDDDNTHPLDAGSKRILELLESAGVSLRRKVLTNASVWLPSGTEPVPSSPLIDDSGPRKAAELVPWSVSTAELEPPKAFDFLTFAYGKQLLCPGCLVGPDLAYWAAASKFAETLVAREQFLPDLVRDEDGAFHARWSAVATGPDQARLRSLAAAMPPAARAMAPNIPSDVLLRDLIDTVADYLIRTTLDRRWSGDGLHQRWLTALHGTRDVLTGSRRELEELERQIREWRRPVRSLADAPFRLCFRLEEPAPESETWDIRYLLQSQSDPSLLVPAAKVWEPKKSEAPLWRHSGFQPREHLLFSLGQAASICPRIEESLRSPAPLGYQVDASGAWEFLSDRAAALDAAGFGVMLPAWWTRRGTRARLTASAHVSSPFSGKSGISMDALLEFDWKLSLGGEPVSSAELTALAKMKAPLVKFRGQWVHMDPAEIRAAAEFWKTRNKSKMAAHQIVRIALGAPPQDIPVEVTGVTADGWMGELLEKLEGRTMFEESPPPAGLQAQLRPYQLRGYSWLSFLGTWGLGACLADDMGLGKTVQTLTLIQRHWNEGVRQPVLLVCPTSVIENWRKEAARFTPDLPVLVHHGTSRLRDVRFSESAQQHAIVVSSYSLLHRDLEHLREIPWSGLVLDEAQNIRNPETRQSTAARSLQAAYRITLTGTPVENNVGDLWAIMEFLNPGLLGSRSHFRKEFYLPIQTWRSPEAIARLKKITAPFILRRLKTDASVISDLPQKLEMNVFCSLTREQASLYSATVKDSLRSIQSAEGIQRRGVVLATISRLKQICNHPAQFLADNSPLPGRSGKLTRLTEMIEEAISVDDRVLVFSQFAEMGGMIRQHLQETFGREVLFLYGGVSRPSRDRMVERFEQESNGPAVFVLSLKAGGTGLNLTRANHVFHFDRWWNPAVENQATDRAFRIGQRKQVQVHKFVCSGTLEEKIDALIGKKSEIAAGVVGTGEAWLTELSTSQLKELLALDTKSVAD